MHQKKKKQGNELREAKRLADGVALTASPTRPVSLSHLHGIKWVEGLLSDPPHARFVDIIDRRIEQRRSRAGVQGCKILTRRSCDSDV
jgi:hypothetical protein